LSHDDLLAVWGAGWGNKFSRQCLKFLKQIALIKNTGINSFELVTLPDKKKGYTVTIKAITRLKMASCRYVRIGATNPESLKRTSPPSLPPSLPESCR